MLIKGFSEPPFASAIEELRLQIESDIKALDGVKQLKGYAEGRDSLKILQWALLKNLERQGIPLDLDDATFSWLMHDSDALEALLTSGDVEDDKWKEAIDMVTEIVRQDPNAKKGLKLKLAIAIGLTFSTEVISMADGSSIDGIERYHNFAHWADNRDLLEPFYNLNAWQMRYVVGSWAKDEELVWARANALEDFRDPNKIGSVTHSMVEYKLYNDDGISVHDSGYYYGKPVTLEWIHTIGGVCGAISKFGSGMAQAFGIPALPVGQPGHCAFIWLKNGTEWYLDNDISGWPGSTTHTGIQYTWKMQAPFFVMMNEAQNNPEKYRLSEKMKILATSFAGLQYKFQLLEEASSVCPQNYALWHGLRKVLAEYPVDRKVIQTTLVNYVEEHEEARKETKNLALHKMVTASTPENAIVIAQGGSEWASDGTEAWVEIDLAGPCTISELSIHWWGTSYSSDYDVLAEINSRYVKVLSRDDEVREDSYYNPWGVLPGWDGKTTKVRLEMRQGNLDPWYGKYYFGIRQIVIMGKENAISSAITFSLPIETSNGEGETALADGNADTYWISNDKKSWINIQLDMFCILDRISFDWHGGIEGKQQVSYLVGNKVYSKSKKGRFTVVDMEGIAGQVRITLRKSKKYTINGIMADGYCYTQNEAFKIKARQGFDEPDLSFNVYLINDIFSVIDNME